MRQQTLAMQVGFEKFARKSRRELFLEEMDKIVPWGGLVALVGPHYPKGESSRPPVGLERMLRLYFLQQWFNLSDPGLEDALYESAALRRFAGINLGREPVPDEATACNFRHLLERHDLGRSMLKTVNEYLAACGIKIATGAIVDATIVHAPSSTKNEEGKRDPEMHQVKKGNQWYFGMKAHVGVDSKQGIVHSAEATAANTADAKVLPQLLHGDEHKVWGDAAYQGQGEKMREKSPRAQDITSRRTRYKQVVDQLQRRKNRTKARVRSKVEHVFRVMKRQFGFDRVRYRGLAKNANRMFACLALVNLYITRKRLVPQGA
ncbi:MAG: IS5 family transposase [Acidobacteriaceae bacterium]